MAVGRVDAAAAGEVGLVDVRGLALRRHPRDVVAQVGGEVVGVAEAEEVSDLVERRRLEVVCVLGHMMAQGTHPRVSSSSELTSAGPLGPRGGFEPHRGMKRHTAVPARQDDLEEDHGRRQDRHHLL